VRKGIPVYEREKVLKLSQKGRHSVGGDNHTLATSLAHAVCLFFGLGSAVRAVVLIRVAAAGATAVKTDAVARAGDTEAFACAAAGGGGDGGSAAGAGEGWDIGLSVGVILRIVVLEVNSVELSGELLEVTGLKDVLGLTRLVRARVSNLGRRDSAALGDVLGNAARLAGGLDGSGTSGWDIEDVQFAAGGGLNGVLTGRVVRDVVAVKDVVVPVALALLEHGALEAEGTLPCASLGGILGERELTGVVVPRTDEVSGLAVGGGAEGEVELDRCHFD